MKTRPGTEARPLEKKSAQGAVQDRRWLRVEVPDPRKRGAVADRPWGRDK